MPSRPLPNAPGTPESSPVPTPLKRFSVFSSLKSNDSDTNDGRSPKQSNRKKSYSRLGTGGSSPQLQYSESMPVLDATAPYAVSSSANVVISASSPASQSQRSFDSDRPPMWGGPPIHDLSPAPPSSPLSRQTTGASNRASADMKRRSYLNRTSKWNSNSSLKFNSPSIRNVSSKSEVLSHSSDLPSRPDYHIKIVCVGDGGCGKTCLMLTYTYGTFPTTYIPTVFENYLTNVRSADGKLIELALWDTAGQEEYDRLRVLSYPEVNLLLICFAIDSPTSLDNVLDKWVPEISHFCPDVPFILVGLKSDLRDTPSHAVNSGGMNPRPHISVQQAKATAERIGANRYMECSAKLSRGISDVFNTAISIVLAEHLGLPEPPIEEIFIPSQSPSAGDFFNKRSIKISLKMPKIASPQPQQTSTPIKTSTRKQPDIISSVPSKAMKKKKHSKCVIL